MKSDGASTLEPLLAYKCAILTSHPLFGDKAECGSLLSGKRGRRFTFLGVMFTKVLIPARMRARVPSKVGMLMERVVQIRFLARLTKGRAKVESVKCTSSPFSVHTKNFPTGPDTTSKSVSIEQ